MRYTISYSLLFKADTIAQYCRSWRSEKVKREEKRSVKLSRSLGKNFYVERFLFTIGPLAISFKLGFLENKLCIIVGIQLRKGGLGDFQWCIVVSQSHDHIMSPLICCSVNIDFAWTIGHVQYLGTHCVLGWFRVVVGWRGVTTCHLVPPGSGVEPSMPPNNHLRHYQPCAMLGKRLAATKHLHFIAIFSKFYRYFLQGLPEGNVLVKQWKICLKQDASCKTGNCYSFCLFI